MRNIRDFLVQEIKKPIEALYGVMRWLVKQTALYVLRFVLWGIFFLMPSFLFAVFGFHWVTGKVRSGIQSTTSQARAASYSSPQPQTSPNFSVIRALSQDLRFWIREFERFRS